MEAWKEKFVSWFATSGRMNRAAFVKRFFGVNLVCMAAVLVIGSRVIEETGSVFASNLVSGLLAALAAVFVYSPMVRRLHDIGRDARLAQAYLCFGIPQGFLLGKVAALPPGSLGLYAFGGGRSRLLRCSSSCWYSMRESRGGTPTAQCRDGRRQRSRRDGKRDAA